MRRFVLHLDKKGIQGELNWSSLTGSDYKKLLENLPSKLYFLIILSKFRIHFLSLYRFVTLEIHEFSYLEDIFEKCKGCFRINGKKRL
jgi:hypothetical protein